jgi:hypothetical protein
MPEIKVKKDSEEYYAIKGMYEAGGTIDVILESIQKIYNIQLTRRTIERFAKAEKWERGKLKPIYEATKLVQIDNILTKFKTKEEKIATNVITKKAKAEGTKKAELILQSDNYKLKMDNAMAEIGVEYTRTFLESLQNIKNGKLVDMEVEGTTLDEKGKPAKVIKRTTSLRPKEFDKIITMMQAFGILQPTPTVAMQVNNTNTQQNNNTGIKVETQFSKISEQEAFQEFCKKIAK